MKTQLGLFILVTFILSFSAEAAMGGTCWSDPEGSYIVEEIPDIRPNGNHQIDCTLILPWGDDVNPEDGAKYPVIGWANGWGWNEVAGENEIDGYKPGLIDWAIDGQFIVIAANQWSPRERDVLQCVAWLVEDSGYKDLIATKKLGKVDVPIIGLSGHSQGGGAVLRSADGKPKGKGLGLDLDITTVIPMNPYGPAWNEVNPDGPVLIVGGDLDTTTPPESYEKAWLQILEGDASGINATLVGGDHNNNAWFNNIGYTCKPEESNFGNYQHLTLLWWQIMLYGDDESIEPFCTELAAGCDEPGKVKWVEGATADCITKEDCQTWLSPKK